MYKRIDMADFMKEISDLPLEAQEDILSNLSEKMIPIEIDSNVYMVHKNVGLLIDSLTLQLKDLIKERESEFVGKKNN